MDLAGEVLMASRKNIISSILFRSSIGSRLGLNITESECMSILGIKGVSTPTELAKYTGLTSGSTTTMLDRLEKKKFIVRKLNPKDRRGVLIEIGKKYIKESQPLVVELQKAHHKLIDNYSEKELKVIADFLTGFSNNVLQHIEKIEKKKRHP